MLINNLSSRLRLSGPASASTREAERRRIKTATRALRTHAEKIAWHLAEMAAAAKDRSPVFARLPAADPGQNRRYDPSHR